MPRTIVQAGLIAGIALFVAGTASAREDNAIFVQIQPTATAPAAEASVDAQKSAAAALLAKAKRDGGVRVIAELRVSPRFGNPLAAQGDDQPATVVRVQTAVLARALKNVPADGVRRFQFIPFIAANVDAAQLKRLLADPALVSVEEDVAAKPSAVQWNIAEIKAPPVWRVAVKGAGYAVAVLDSGVQTDHPIFQGRVVSEACYSTNDPRGSVSFCPNGKSSSTAKNSGRNCPVSIDGCEHGTHVAGIAVGYSAQSQGVATEAKLIVIQIASKGIVPAVCGGHAPCIATLESDQIAALERVYALRKTYKIAAVNMSLGGGRFRRDCDAQEPALTKIITLLRKAGIATVAASGNEYFTGYVNSPACISAAVAVGSTGRSDAVSAFSNQSAKVALMAPGENIISALPVDRYGPESGTSMAAPHVAGAFAMLRQAVPNATVDQIIKALADTGVPVTRDGITKPRIDLLGAFNELTNVRADAAPR